MLYIADEALSPGADDGVFPNPIKCCQEVFKKEIGALSVLQSILAAAHSPAYAATAPIFHQPLLTFLAGSSSAKGIK